jgi:hypothetical protein
MAILQGLHPERMAEQAMAPDWQDRPPHRFVPQARAEAVHPAENLLWGPEGC